MKKLYTTISILMIAASAFAQQQLPNNGFENWAAFTQCSGVDSVVGYSTIDQSAYYGTGICVTSPGISKSVNAQSGTYALSLKPVNFLGSLHGSLFTLQNKFDKNATDLTGIPFTGRPVKLTGYYQFNSGSNSDSLSVLVSFVKSGKEIGVGYFTTGTTKSVYTKFETDIFFLSEEQPDSLIFITQMGDNENNANKNTSALVDNFVFLYSSTGLDPDQLLPEAVTVVQKDRVIQFSENVAHVRLTNIIGNTVIENEAQTQNIDVNSLQHGVYILNYYYNNVPKSQKIVIN